MLTVFMFHKVTEPMEGLDDFENFLIYLKKNYKIVLPGEKVSMFGKYASLTFDDAYFDFYYCVYPLLKKYNIPSILAVSTNFILDSTTVSTEERLRITQSEAMSNDKYLQAPFCTWQELKEMTESKLVELASHHHTHASVKVSDFDPDMEIVYSKRIIQEKTNCKVNTLIYPYGAFNHKAHNVACKHYDYIMRIGSTININWKNRNKLIYRVDADNFWKNRKIITIQNRLSWMFKYISNIIRNK